VRGFTLIELLIAVLVAGTLIIIGVSVIGENRRESGKTTPAIATGIGAELNRTVDYEARVVCYKFAWVEGIDCIPCSQLDARICEMPPAELDKAGKSR